MSDEAQNVDESKLVLDKSSLIEAQKDCELVALNESALSEGDTYSLHRHSRARPFCCAFDTFSPLRTLLLFFQYHAFSNVCKQTGGSIYTILLVCYYSSDQSLSKNMRIMKTHLDKHL